MALSKLMGRGGREEGQALMGLGTDRITDCEGACSPRLHLDQAVLLGLTLRFERAGVCSSLWGALLPLSTPRQRTAGERYPTCHGRHLMNSGLQKPWEREKFVGP